MTEKSTEKKPTKIAIRFVKSFGPYNPGDVAGKDTATAESLVKSGVAVVHGTAEDRRAKAAIDKAEQKAAQAEADPHAEVDDLPDPDDDTGH